MPAHTASKSAPLPGLTPQMMRCGAFASLSGSSCAGAAGAAGLSYRASNAPLDITLKPIANPNALTTDARETNRSMD